MIEELLLTPIAPDYTIGVGNSPLATLNTGPGTGFDGGHLNIPRHPTSRGMGGIDVDY